VADGSEVAVTVVQEKNAFEHIMAELTSVRSIDILIQRPNPGDHLKTEETRMAARLERQDAKEMRIRLEAAAGRSLKPDDETTGLAHVATRNGQVDVVGKDANGVTTNRSSVDSPLISPVKFEEVAHPLVSLAMVALSVVKKYLPK
jgi:hypothetical protein